MRSLGVVMLHPGVQACLQFLQRRIQFSLKGNLVKRMRHNLADAFAAVVRLRMPRLGLGYLYRLCPDTLMLMRFQLAALTAVYRVKPCVVS